MSLVTIFDRYIWSEQHQLNIFLLFLLSSSSSSSSLLLLLLRLTQFRHLTGIIDEESTLVALFRWRLIQIKSDEATHAHSAWFTGVIASVYTPLRTRKQQLPTLLAQQCSELLRPLARSRSNPAHLRFMTERKGQVLMSERLSCSCDGFCGASEREAGAHVTCRLADGTLERNRRLFSNL